MWFTFVTARLFIFLSIQPRLTATLLRSCSVVNSPIRRVGLAPTLRPASLAQASVASVANPKPVMRRSNTSNSPIQDRYHSRPLPPDTANYRQLPPFSDFCRLKHRTSFCGKATCNSVPLWFTNIFAGQTPPGLNRSVAGVPPVH